MLIGFQGVGKSFFGKRLGELLGRRWIDTDLLINAHFGNKYTNREIFLDLGEKKFRVLEGEILESLASEEGAIISTGGGVVEIEGIQNTLPFLGNILYLEEELDVLQSRWDSGPRVYLNGKSIEELFARRCAMYEALADETVEGKWDQILLADSLQSLLLENPTARE